MSELWLPPETRHALWDADAQLLRVIGWRPGPAGVSAVDLTDGLRVVVDHARPTTLAEVTIDAAGGRVADDHAALLVDLLGPGASDVVLRLPGRGGSGRPVRLPAGRDRIDEVQVSFARMVLGADLGDDAGVDEAWRPVALLEAALLAFDFHRPLALGLARRGLALLEETGGPSHPKAASQVASILQTIGHRAGSDGVAVAASHSAGRLARASSPAWAAQAVAPDGARRPPAQSRMQRPLPVAGDHRGWAWLDDANNVAVTAPGLGAGAWARVFRASDRLLLGMAPVRPTGGGADARIVIPPTPPADLVVDVVDDPATPLRAPAHDRLRGAVGAGREAARLSRLGHHGAGEAWDECARRWEGLGDSQRANLARRHGQPQMGSAPWPRSTPIPIRPLLVDGSR